MKKTVVLAVTVLTLSMAGTAVFAAGRGNGLGQNNSGTRMNCGSILTACHRICFRYLIQSGEGSFVGSRYS